MKKIILLLMFLCVGSLLLVGCNEQKQLVETIDTSSKIVSVSRLQSEGLIYIKNPLVKSPIGNLSAIEVRKDIQTICYEEFKPILIVPSSAIMNITLSDCILTKGETYQITLVGTLENYTEEETAR